MASTFPSLPVIDQVSSLLVQNATGGQFRATAGGPVIPITDLLGVPLTEITSNSIGLSLSFLAPDANRTGVVTFGTVSIPIISNEARDSGLQAAASAVSAGQAAASAAQAVLDAQQALIRANAAAAAVAAPTDAAVDAGITRAGLVTATVAAASYALRSPDFVANRAYIVGELVVNGGVIYRKVAAGSSATFVPADWAAISASGGTTGPAAGSALVLRWNGTAFIDTAAVVATAANRPANTFRLFIGGNDAQVLGLTIDGDMQFGIV